MTLLTAQTVIWIGLATIIAQLICIALQIRAIRRRGADTKNTLL